MTRSDKIKERIWSSFISIKVILIMANIYVRQYKEDQKQNVPSFDLCSSGTSATRHWKKGFSQKPSRSSSTLKQKADIYETGSFYLSNPNTLKLNEALFYVLKRNLFVYGTDTYIFLILFSI